MSYIEYAWKSKGHKLDALLEIARPKNSPVHGEFEWNDDVAGENWRIHQARLKEEA